jgi:hypothetical protein
VIGIELDCGEVLVERSDYGFVKLQGKAHGSDG